MTDKYLVEKYLEREPLARERRNKDRAIVNLLLHRYPEISGISKERLVEIVHDFSNLDRYWRQTMLERPDLRGKDYETKKIVEQRKVLSLGYEVGFNQKLKVL